MCAGWRAFVNANYLTYFDIVITELWRELGGVVFVDAGNVFRRAGDLDFGALR